MHQNVEEEELEWTKTFYELSCRKPFLSMVCLIYNFWSSLSFHSSIIERLL
jgi:hypothetical protein